MFFKFKYIYKVWFQNRRAKFRKTKTKDITADIEHNANDQPSPQLILVCGNCKCKKELTTDNISTYFGYKRWVQIFRLHQMPIKNKQYSTTRSDTVEAESGEQETRGERR